MFWKRTRLAVIGMLTRLPLTIFELCHFQWPWRSLLWSYRHWISCQGKAIPRQASFTKL